MFRKLMLILLLTATPWAYAAQLKIASLAPDGTQWMADMRAAGERVQSRTDGRVEVKFYPGGVMGNAATVLRKMRVGQLHGGAFTTGELGEIYPDYQLLGIPFLFRDLDEVFAVRARIDESLAAGLRERGFELLGVAGGGFGYLMSDRAIADRYRLVAAKVWVPEGDAVAALSLELAGVSPIPLPLSDVYTGLQTGLVDTVVNSTVGAIAFQWHTRLTHMTDIPVSYVAGGVAIQKRAFDRLSVADQAVVRDEFGATLARLQDQDVIDNESAREALLGQGIEAVALPPEAVAYWQELAERTLAALEADSDLEYEHIADLRALLAEIRSEASP